MENRCERSLAWRPARTACWALRKSGDEVGLAAESEIPCTPRPAQSGIRWSRRSAIRGLLGLLCLARAKGDSCYGAAASADVPGFQNAPIGVTVLVDGPPIPAALAGFDATGELRLQVPDTDAPAWQPISKGVDEMVSWGACPDLRPGDSFLCFGDGTFLAGNWLEYENGLVHWRHPRFGNLDVPTNRAAGIVSSAPFSVLTRDRLVDQLAKPCADYDRVILANGDALRGRILRGDEDRIHVSSDFGPVEMPRSRITAVSFREGGFPRSFSDAVIIGLEDGSRIVLSRRADGRFPVTLDTATQGEPGTAAYHRLKVEDRDSQPSTWEANVSVRYFQAFTARVAYLSDLPVAEYVHVPYLSYAQPLGLDRTPRGAFLRSEKAVYLKGLGTYSACRVTYRLERKYRRFCSNVAMDDAALGRGDASCRVAVDRRTVWHAESMRSPGALAAVDVDVSGADRLDLIVEFGPRADELDYVDWLNARFVL